MIQGAVTTVVAVIVMLGVLVVVHEAGHFFVARFFGIGAPVFSVGMGPRLFGVQYKGTDFRISAFPLGGYVQLSGADVFGEEDFQSTIPDDEHFMKKPVWQRLLVMLAGPFANLVLPFVVIVAVLMLGRPTPDNQIGIVIEGSSASSLGFSEEDRIVSVGDELVDNWDDIEYAVRQSLPGAVSLTLSGASERQVVVPANEIPLGVDGVADFSAFGIEHGLFSSRVAVQGPGTVAFDAGVQTGDVITKVDGTDVRTMEELRNIPEGEHQITVLPRSATSLKDTKVFTVEVGPDGLGVHDTTMVVGAFVEDSAGEKAGLERFDEILSVGSTTVRSWDALIAAVNATVTEETVSEDMLGSEIDLVILRNGAQEHMRLRPKVTRQVVLGRPVFRPLIGVSQIAGTLVAGEVVSKYYGPVEASFRAADRWMYNFTNTLAVLGNVVTGRLHMKEAAGGPGTIALVAKQSAEAGIFVFVQNMAMISFSLGIMNLLPVPLLDGGRIVFYLLEWVRGRPLPMVIRERIEMVGILFLVALMLRVLVIDAGRIMGTQ